MMRALAAAGVLAVLLAGCGGNRTEPASVSAPEDDGLRRVLAITDVDIGRTFDGILLTVRGETETAGWSSATLRVQDGQAEVGVLSFDLLARPPAAAPSGALAALPAARQVQAALPIALPALQGVSELRLNSQTGVATVTLR